MTVGQLIGVILFVAALIVLWKIRLILLLVFAAVTFATVINRMVRRFQRSGLKRGFAIALAVGTILTIIVGFFAFIVPTISQQLQQLVDRLPQALEKIEQWYGWLENRVPPQILEDFESIDALLQNIPGSTSDWFGGFFTLFSNSIGFLVNLLLVIVLIIMLLANPSLYRQIFVLIFPAFYRSRVEGILDECEENIVGWALGMLFNMTVIGVFSGIGLWLLGVPLVLVNAFIAAFLTYIPNIGPTLSVIPPTALALTEAPWKALGVIILYVAIQQLESLILTPMVMERQVSLPPAITLLSLVIFGAFFGVLGVFLALPLVVVLQVWLREVLVKDIMNDWTKNGNDRSHRDASEGEGRSQNQPELPSDVN